MTAKRKVYLAVACTLIVAVGAQERAEGQAPNKLHWGPAENLERVDSRILGTARKPVNSAACNRSDRALIDALCSLAQTSSVEGHAKQAAGPVHLKSRLVDSQVLRTGSPNFSAPNFSAWSLERQDNDAVVIRDARSIAQLAETFERPWARPGNNVWRPER